MRGDNINRYVALVYPYTVIFGWYKLKVEDACHFWVSMDNSPPLHAHATSTDFDIFHYSVKTNEYE